MQCIKPIKAGFDRTGNIVYKSHLADPGQVPFAFKCRKCLPCRLEIGREKGIRCYHESQMHKDNIFLTLTYAPEHLKDPKLNYFDFQLFMKSLRELRTRDITDPELRKKFKISYMVTGEYGELNKRPHWHAIIFNYRPSDSEYKYTTDHGDTVWKSAEIDSLWKKGSSEFGSVTLDSASYVARYSAKKLVHGNDQDHDFHPLHKTSSKNAIGRSWIEKYYLHTFQNGFVVLPNGQTSKIPRYYVDWAKKHQPDIYNYYVTHVQPKIIAQAIDTQQKEERIFFENLWARNANLPIETPLTRSKVKETILKNKFKRLQEYLKL